jgi:hypothetical protein
MPPDAKESAGIWPGSCASTNIESKAQAGMHLLHEGAKVKSMVVRSYVLHPVQVVIISMASGVSSP